MNSYQMVLHRPVETTGVFGNFKTEVAENVTFQERQISSQSACGEDSSEK
jgi:hypothetical protein